MKKLLSLLLTLCILTGCQGPAASSLPQVSSAEGSVLEQEYTEEEQFLQKAYWYLQSDEKAFLSWENGMLEDYRTEASRKIIGPTGETEIQKKDLQRVIYEVWELAGGSWRQSINLYFEKDGTFLGTDGSLFYEDGREEQRDSRWFDGELSCWLFLSSPEIKMDETLEGTVVLRRKEDADTRERTFRAFAPMIAYFGYFQNGKEISGGIDAAGQELTLSVGEVYTETHTLTPQSLPDLQRGFEPGKVTVMATVELSEGAAGAHFTLTKLADFTITE